MRPSLAIPAAALVIPAAATALFLAWMHPQVLDPTNVGWILDGEDRGQNAAGLAAYLRAPPVWPSTRQHLLSAPEGVTLLFTDSNPLLGLVLRPFAAVLPPGLQFVGPWLALCVLLQVALAWAIVRPRAPDATCAAMATLLLAAQPVLIARWGHPNLCAQWLILWGLWIFLDEGRSRRPAWWIAVLAIAGLVHSYLFLMVAAIWGSAMLRSLVTEPDRVRTLAGAFVTALAAALVLTVHGVAGAEFESTGTYGRFAMALDSWWRFGRSFEGFQYLGAGMLLLCLVAATVLARSGAGQAPADLRRMMWLLPALMLLGLVALGTDWRWDGRTLLTVPLPPDAIALLDPVRASGRLFWPATYALALAVLVLAMRAPHARILLAGACLIQTADLAPFVAEARATSAEAADRRVYRVTVSPEWDALVARAGSVAFYPLAAIEDLRVMEEVQWRAILACRPTTLTYTSRMPAEVRRRVAAEERAFEHGRPDPARLHILYGPAPAWAAARVRELDGVRFVPPTRPAPSRAC